MAQSVLSSDESVNIFSQSNLKKINPINDSPLKCPLTKCDVIIGESNLLSHFIVHHQRDDDSVEYQEIKENEKISLMVDKNYFQFGKCICLGLLTYLSPNSTAHKHTNSMLTTAIRSMEPHLPILIMGYKTNYNELIDHRKIDRDPMYDVILIWLVTIETKIPIYGSVTAYNEDQNVSSSSIMKLRNFKQSQDPVEIFRNNINYLCLNSGFVQSIQSSSDETLLIEISLQENFL